MRVGQSGREAVKAARAKGVHPGYALGRDYEGLDDALLVAVTEKRTPADIERLVGGAREVTTKLIYERSQPGRRASSLPRSTSPSPRCRRVSPAQAPPRLPEVSEPELVRHFTELSTRNFGIDTGFYPLGSCTMKHNPRLNERAVGLPGFKDLHPLQEEDGAQGALELMWRLQEILAEVSGLHGVSLQPAAGLAGRADRADALPRVLPRPRRGRAAPRDRRPRHGARHEPGERDDGRLRARRGEDRRAREHRRRGRARQGRPADGRPDGHEPVDARPLRREHRGDRADLPRRRRAHVLRRREPERRLRHLAARRHGLRRRAHQPAQDVLAAARRRRPRRRADRGDRGARAVPARARGDPERGRDVRPRLRPPEVDRQGACVHRAVRRLRPLVRVHPHATGRGSARCPRRRC